MKKTIREALVIILITLLLSLLSGVLSPVGRILLKKGLGIKTVGATPGRIAAAGDRR